MFQNFVPSPAKRLFPATVRHLESCCRHAISVESLLLSWLEKERHVLMFPILDSNELLIEIRFYFRKKFVGFTRTSLRSLVEQYPGTQPIDEYILKFNDQDGGRPNEPWYVERSNRYGMWYDEKAGINRAPALAALHIILSYLCVSNTTVRCFGRSLSEEETIRIQCTYRAEDAVISGWREEVDINKNELRKLSGIPEIVGLMQ